MKKYGLSSFIKLPLQEAPFWASYSVVSRLFSSLFTSIKAILTASFVDTALAAVAGTKPHAAVIAPLSLLVLIIALSYFLDAMGNLSQARIEMRLNEGFRAKLAEKRAKMEYRHIEDDKAWDLISRVCRNPAGKVLEGLSALLNFIGCLVSAASVLALVSASVWWAGVAACLLLIPMSILSVKLGRKNYSAEKEADKGMRRADYLSSLLTDREGEEERAAFGYVDALNDRWTEKYESAIRITRKYTRRYFIQVKSTGLSFLLLAGGVALALTPALAGGGMTAGLYVGLVTAVFSLVQDLSWTLPWSVSQIAKDKEYMKDLNAFSALSETEDALCRPAPEKDFTLRKIEFQNVSFRYPGTDRYILRRLNLSMEAGRHYAFVGVNGAGKTTVTKLLTGLYDNYEGEILLNGRELRSLPFAARKALFAVAFQDFARYEVSLKDNILLGDQREDGKTQVESAIADIGLADTAAKLPEGENTYLGKIKEGGRELSGGEWQRVVLARVLQSPAQMRILDEPTAALDPMAESKVYELFGQLSKGHTTLFITHRLGAARLADEIFVIDGGRVAESGSHDGLMEKNGLYHDMFESQRSWFV